MLMALSVLPSRLLALTARVPPLAMNCRIVVELLEGAPGVQLDATVQLPLMVLVQLLVVWAETSLTTRQASARPNTELSRKSPFNLNKYHSARIAILGKFQIL